MPDSAAHIVPASNQISLRTLGFYRNGHFWWNHLWKCDNTVERMRAVVAIIVLVALPVLGLAQKPSSGLNVYSVEKEIALGKRLSQEIRQQARIVEDPIIGEFVNRIGQNLARNSEVPFPITFTLLESDEIGAFTLPGGFIYVNTAIFTLSDNEAELASVIAHELGHAAARHATRQATRQQALSVASVPASIFGGLPGMLAGQLAGPLAFNHYSRAYETEADLLGIQYLSQAGYDPEASVDMFERVQATERARPGAVAQLFRSHPMTSDRIAKTQKDIGTMLPNHAEYVINTSEYEDVRARLNDLLLAHGAKDAAAPRKPTLLREGESFDEDRPVLPRR